MTKLLILISIVFLFFSHFSNAQSKKNYFKVEGGYLSGIGNIHYDDRVTFVNESEAFRLRVSYGHFLTPKTSAGLGFGLDGYHNPNHNTLPVFFELRRFLQAEGNSLFVNLNLGAAIELSQEFEKGLHLSTGLGYLIVMRKLEFLPSVGINIQNIANGKALLIDLSTFQHEEIITKITLTSISFNLGIQF